jgi:hypothetical protein
MKILLLGGFVLVACGKGSKMHTVAIGDSGFVADVPEDWTIEDRGAGMFKVKGGPLGRAPLVEVLPAPLDSVDNIVAAFCKGHGELSTETLRGGGVFVKCQVPSHFDEGASRTAYYLELPNGDRLRINCFGSGSSDATAELPIKICKSIRKK